MVAISLSIQTVRAWMTLVSQHDKTSPRAEKNRKILRTLNCCRACEVLLVLKFLCFPPPRGSFMDKIGLSVQRLYFDIRSNSKQGAARREAEDSYGKC